MARTAGTRSKGSGIPAKGKGWGGPAKGAGTTAPVAEVNHMRWDPAKLADKEALAAEMKGVLYDRAHNSDNDHARIAAAGRLLEQIESKAPQRQDHTSGGAPITIITGVPRAADEP